MDNLDAKVMEAEEYLHFEDDVYSTVKDEVEDGKIVIYTLSSVQIIRTLFTLLTIILIFVFAVMVMTIFLSTDKIAASKTKIIDEVTRAFDCVRARPLCSTRGIMWQAEVLLYENEGVGKTGIKGFFCAGRNTGLQPWSCGLQPVCHQ